MIGPLTWRRSTGSCNPFIQVLSEKFSEASQYTDGAPEGCNPFIQVLSEKYFETVENFADYSLSCNPFIQVLSEK